VEASDSAFYQSMPPLSGGEYADLKADIAARGVLVPVEVDERGAVLDGHHRLRAWHELRAAGVNVPDYPRVVREGWSEP
jgi:ParB-like chromosome segregation protein Spo0J